MDTRRKRVLLVITNFGYGGAERSFAELSRMLSDRYEVFVTVFDKESHQHHYLHDGEVIDMRIPAGATIVGKYRSFSGRIKLLRQFKKEKGIDITISFLEGADYINILSKGPGKKVISIRGSKSFDPNIKGVSGFIRNKFLIPFLYNKADLIVTLNDGIKYELHKFYGISSRIPIKTIFSSFDFEKMRSKKDQPLSAAEQRAFQSGYILISHGRLAGEKGFDHLIKILSRLKKQNSDFRLFLIGDGSAEETLKRLCRNEGLTFADYDDQVDCGKVDVLFWGYQANPFKFLAKAQMFICSSLTEGFGNSIVEAMFSGIPVLAADCPWGPRDILNGKARTHDFSVLSDCAEITEAGVLMPLVNSPGAYEKWTDMIMRVRTDKDLSHAIVAGAQKRLSLFSQDYIKPQWISALEQLMDDTKHL